MKNKRIKLKNNKKTKKVKIYIFIIIIIMIVASSILLIKKTSKIINDKILKISEVEIDRISKNIIESSVDKTILDKIEKIDFFKIERDKNQNIKMIDLNIRETNGLLSDITKNTNKYLKELEEGKSTIIDINKNIITNTNIVSKKEGIIFEIPMGILTQNSFFNNLGPKIPVRVSFNGNCISKIDTKLESYGINSSMIKVYVSVTAYEKIIMPVMTKTINVNLNLLVATKIINGEIPNYYLGNTNK